MKKKEEKASGVSPGHTELDDSLLEMYERKKEADNEMLESRRENC